MITLPIVIEKQIIYYLAHVINKFNKDLPLFGEDENKLLEKEIEISNLIQSIAMVNKSFFNSLSSYLNVSVDFNNRLVSNNILNYVLNKKPVPTKEESEFTLVKNENVKYLKLNVNLYQLAQQTEDPTIESKLVEIINGGLVEFKNLKKVIVVNVDDVDIYLANKIQFTYIKLGFLDLSMPNEDPEISNPDFPWQDTPSPISENIKEIKDVEGYGAPTITMVRIFKPIVEITNLTIDKINVEQYKEFYEQLCNGGKKEDETFGDANHKPTESCFTNVKSLVVENYQVQNIESLYYLLKLSPNTTRFYFQICFDNLVYQLGGKTTKGCMCSNFHECNKNFLHYWEYVSNAIQNHKQLLSLSIGHHCTFPIGYSTPFTLPDQFVSAFGSAIANNKSIIVLSTSKLPPSALNFYEYIISNNQTINSFSCYFLNFGAPADYVKDLPDFFKKNNHVKYFSVEDSTHGVIFDHNSRELNK